MAIQFDKLTAHIRKLGDVALERRDEATRQIDELLAKLLQHATNWDHIDACFARIEHASLVDKQKYRAARPLNRSEALNCCVDAPSNCPERATIIAADGSQALPSRHSPFLYSLINVGWLVYHHGSPQPPDHDTLPQLFYFGDGETEGHDDLRGAIISIKRDMAEIETLARLVWEQRYAAAPVVALLDQRLQYWPIGLNNKAESDRYVGRWIDAIHTIQRCNGLLVGYIERPETSAIIRMLYTLDLGSDAFDSDLLNERPQLSDPVIFRRLLQPGQRSPVFEIVNFSTNYAPFRDKQQEICFFYYKPPGVGDITRIDMPRWAAQQPEVIDWVHALLQSQCNLLGNYPYALTRADEVAVVQGQDKEYLEHLVMLEMQRRGISGSMTGKQLGKEWSRAGKRQHAL